ncbi:alpha-tocopherol transfer protein isoform X3 [Cryptotermes secundus]|nr:alpha-tocopherol transfer protein isoform X3 [Cryptotermes secundus]XP_023706067.1 alpha-tocopherol transfer protein isoform X3 [Cryptotermes secundus]XP_023706068.1 alpha-tocopherol transfer protein isoform X3 [Cryptotermes secundus]XP_023706070.1 alpha-tocopherol transfer protein isoform X3 [Cryptotermes secundus]XP_023706071.1 alpha-tocopherol transfer protein isoform X3 [Cryptotermes secundus]
MTLEGPTEAQLKRMREELQEDPEAIKEDMIRFREWLSKQPHLPHHMEDARLERFLYGCKLSLERAKRVLDTYYMVRATAPEFFRDRDPLSVDMQLCFQSIHYVPLPVLTHLGYRPTLLRLADCDVNRFDVRVLATRIVMSLDARLLEERCLNNVMIIDLDGYTMGHYTKVSPTQALVRKGLLCIQDAFPLRLAQVHLLNAPVFISNIMNLFRPFLKEKFFSKVFFHCSGYESLYEHVPRDALPREYGGKLDSIQELTERWNQKLVSLRPWFLQEQLISMSDESRRPPGQRKSTASALALGPEVHGTFRQLSID